MGKNLPEDYGIDALALEAERRGKVLGRPYSYGKLMADTSKEEREEILRAYRSGTSRQSRERKTAFLEEEKNAMEKLRQKNLGQEEEEE